MLRIKCLNTEFFWSIFFCIRTEYGDFSGPYFPVFGPKKIPHLDTFQAVSMNRIFEGGLFMECSILITNCIPHF